MDRFFFFFFFHNQEKSVWRSCVLMKQELKFVSITMINLLTELMCCPIFFVLILHSLGVVTQFYMYNFTCTITTKLGYKQSCYLILTIIKKFYSCTWTYPPTAGVRQRSRFWSTLISCNFLSFPEVSKTSHKINTSESCLKKMI